MQRVAVIADSHFDEHSRFEECIALHDWIVADAKKRRVDLFIHTGDVFERKSTPRERIAVANWLRSLAEVAPIVIVRGNHDVLGDLAIYRALRTRFPVTVEEAAGVHVVRGIAVAAVAWPRKAHLLASSDGGRDETEQVAADAMRNLLRGLGAQLATHDGPRILAMHAMVRGSITSVGQPLVGCDLELGLDDLALANAQIAALGHIHCGQDWMHGEMPIVYPGSPRRTAFGEIEEKGYVVIDIDNEGTAVWERVIVPATPMILLGARWWPTSDPPAFGFDGESSPTELARGGAVERAEIRFRYEVSSDHRDAAKRAAAEVRDGLIAAGAAAVKVEEVVTATVRARAPEVAEAKTLDEKLHALWRARRDVPEPPRTERLLTKVHELEGEAAA
jgi:exonuclease SbcD